MKQLVSLLLISFSSLSILAQDSLKTDSIVVITAVDSVSSRQSNNLNTAGSEKVISPYYTKNWKTEGGIVAAAVAVNLVGYQLIKNKKDLTLDELATKTKDRLPFFDRGNAGYYSEQDEKNSYFLFDAMYVYPVALMLFNKKEKSKFGQLFLLYVETVGITGSMYTLTAGLVHRSRPLVYGTKAPLDERLNKGAQRSFYGGHVATAAALSFFTAKVFQDFNPKSKAVPYLWAAAYTLPALMAYNRYISGKHFLSDCVLSYAIGAATGYLVPQLHKNHKLKNVSLTPTIGSDSKGLSLVYRF
jgi:hypothetical protein